MSAHDLFSLREVNHHYHDKGYLSVRKNGQWGRLCLRSEDSPSLPEAMSIQDLGRAVCKAITYQ